MKIKKRLCTCGQLKELSSYFKDGLRLTVCDDCATKLDFKNIAGISVKPYDEIKKESKLNKYDPSKAV